jgi:hypothetical protein
MNRHILPNILGNKPGNKTATHTKTEIITQNPLALINAFSESRTASPLFANIQSNAAVGNAKNKDANIAISQLWKNPSLDLFIRLNLAIYNSVQLGHKKPSTHITCPRQKP